MQLSDLQAVQKLVKERARINDAAAEVAKRLEKNNKDLAAHGVEVDDLINVVIN